MTTAPKDIFLLRTALNNMAYIITSINIEIITGAADEDDWYSVQV